MDNILKPLLNANKHSLIMLYYIPNYNNITLLHKELNLSFNAVRSNLKFLEIYNLIHTQKSGRTLYLRLTEKGRNVLNSLIQMLNYIGDVNE